MVVTAPSNIPGTRVGGLFYATGVDGGLQAARVTEMCMVKAPT